MWQMADPIEVSSLDDLVKFTDQNWKTYIQESIDEESIENGFLELAADSLHKDNVSGGLPYSIEIPKQPSVDAHFINEPHGTTFINYLRICFEHCGFPGMAQQKDNEIYNAFCNKVKPQLKKI